MSPRDRSGEVTVLRKTIARIAGDGSANDGLTRDGRSPSSTAGRVALGCGLALDRMLRGGLRRGTLSEIVAGAPGDAGAASGFALALAVRFAAAARGPVVWIVEDRARAETGAPYAPGLAAHGLDPERLVVVRAACGADGLWAAEEALKCAGVAAVLLDLWRVRSYDLVASRRLVLAAARGGTPGLLIPAGAPGAADLVSSAAHIRFEVVAVPGPPLSVGRRLPLPGVAAWSVRLARIRAGPAGAAAEFDRDKHWPLVWDHEEAWFRDALSLPAPAVPRDRPRQAPRAGVRAA